MQWHTKIHDDTYFSFWRNTYTETSRHNGDSIWYFHHFKSAQPPMVYSSLTKLFAGQLGHLLSLNMIVNSSKKSCAPSEFPPLHRFHSPLPLPLADLHECSGPDGVRLPYLAADLPKTADHELIRWWHCSSWRYITSQIPYIYYIITYIDIIDSHPLFEILWDSDIWVNCQRLWGKFTC